MTDYYVNKSGDDANGGTDPSTDARLTIGSAIGLLSSGDTLYVGSGCYEEGQIPIHQNRQGATIQGDGYVEIDAIGNNTVFNAHYQSSSMGTWFYIRNIKMRNANHGLRGDPSYTTYVYFYGCRFDNILHSIIYQDGGRSYFWVDHCIINGCPSVFQAPSREGHWRIKNSIIYNVTNEVMNNPYNDTDLRWPVNQGNIYHTIGGAHGLWNMTGTNPYLGGQNTDWADNYYYNFSGNLIKYKNVEYANLTAWQAYAVGYDIGSVWATDPQLADPDNGILFLRPTSPVIGSGVIASYIGPWERCTSYSSGYSTSGFWSIQAAPSSDAGTKWARTSGTVELDGMDIKGEGIVVSPVWDLGGIYEIQGFDGIFKETYPNNVIDYDNDDTKPNRKNLRYRVNDNPFYQDDGIISWTTIEMAESISVSGRYVQVELVFRTDGVAA